MESRSQVQILALVFNFELNEYNNQSCVAQNKNLFKDSILT